MSSSGTYSWSISNGVSVLAAFERIQVRLPEIRQEHLFSARNEINLLLAEWGNKQVNLWKVELISVALVNGTATYDIPARVVMILDAYVSTNEGAVNQNDTYITPISRTDYASYSQKMTAGIPTIYWFDRLISPTLTTYPVINTDGYYLNYYAVSQMEDANLPSGETPDIPYLWTDAFVAGLAYRLARIYKPEIEAVRKADAMESWMVAATQGTENVPVKIAPGIGRYYP